MLWWAFIIGVLLAIEVLIIKIVINDEPHLSRIDRNGISIAMSLLIDLLLVIVGLIVHTLYHLELLMPALVMASGITAVASSVFLYKKIIQFCDWLTLPKMRPTPKLTPASIADRVDRMPIQRSITEVFND